MEKNHKKMVINNRGSGAKTSAPRDEAKGFERGENDNHKMSRGSGVRGVNKS